jgi:hypothetical protein
MPCEGWNKQLLKRLVRWATLLVAGRAEIKYEKDYNGWDPVSAAQPEGAWKVIDHFKDLARGHALIDGRKKIKEADLELIAHVAISALPGQIRPVIRRLRDADCVTSSECEALCGVSRPTARNRLRELELLLVFSRPRRLKIQDDQKTLAVSQKNANAENYA